MPNPAPVHRSALVAILISATCAGACAAQSTGSTARTSPDLTVRQFVLPTEFRIQAESSRGYRFQILMTDDRSWSAVMETGGQVWTATERGCPAFQAALGAFGRLPPLYPGPYDLRDNSQPRQFGPRAPHAEFWTLRLAGFAPDHTNIDMEISGSQGPYPRWASDTVAAIRECGPPTA